MKFHYLLLLSSMVAACSVVKTRKEAAEDAKAKAAATAEASPAVGPIDEDSDGEAADSGPPAPVDDQVLDDELAALGIDPSNPTAKPQGTPEPEVQRKIPPKKKSQKKPKKKK